jgi:ketosteroid isomerase-like protein
MRKWLLLALFVAVILPAKAQQQEPSAEESRILALENAWNKAEEEKDVRALDMLLDDSLVYVDWDGSKMNKTQFIATIRAPELHPAQIVNESQEAHVFGDSAIVTGIYREKGTNKGKPYLRRGRFTDTWIYRSGTWVCVASQSTLIVH